MKRIFIAAIIAIVIFTGIALFWMLRPTAEDRIWEEINTANYCSIKDDCVLLESKCPFDCYLAVNRAEAARIGELVSAFDSQCVSSCVAPPEYDCVESACTIILPYVD